jgi:UDP-N-acetylmuramoyl-tripeptide--D-alanyl-D-alanine ligase
MLELGEESLKEHQSIVDYLNTTDFDVRLVGSEYLKTHRDKKIKTYPSRFELMEELKSVKLPPTQFLLKGSRGIRLEEIVEVL